MNYLVSASTEIYISSCVECSVEKLFHHIYKSAAATTVHCVNLCESFSLQVEEQFFNISGLSMKAGEMRYNYISLFCFSHFFYAQKRNHNVRMPSLMSQNVCDTTSQVFVLTS